jgi:hypothetical protein
MHLTLLIWNHHAIAKTGTVGRHRGELRKYTLRGLADRDLGRVAAI